MVSNGSVCGQFADSEGSVRIQIILHVRKVSSGHCSPLKHFIVCNDSVCGQFADSEGLYEFTLSCISPKSHPGVCSFSKHSIVQMYPMIHFTDCEGPDQTAHPHITRRYIFA